MGTAQAKFEGVLPEVIEYGNDVTGTGNGREIISCVFFQ
jgi:hypothetical protein